MKTKRIRNHSVLYAPEMTLEEKCCSLREELKELEDIPDVMRYDDCCKRIRKIKCGLEKLLGDTYDNI